MSAGFLLMLRIRPGANYFADVLPAVVVLGLGLVVDGGTADRHGAGIGRRPPRRHRLRREQRGRPVGALMAVAAIPMAAGITGDSYRDPLAFQNGFDNALWITAVLAIAGGRSPGFSLAEPRTRSRADPGPRPPPHHLRPRSPALRRSPAESAQREVVLADGWIEPLDRIAEHRARHRVACWSRKSSSSASETRFPASRSIQPAALWIRSSRSPSTSAASS